MTTRTKPKPIYEEGRSQTIGEPAQRTRTIAQRRILCATTEHIQPMPLGVLEWIAAAVAGAIQCFRNTSMMMYIDCTYVNQNSRIDIHTIYEIF